MLMWRNRIFNKREPRVSFVKIANSIFFGLLMLSLYYNVGGLNKVDIENMLGAMFFLLVGCLMNYLFGSIMVFQLERPVFLREQAN